MQIIDWTILSSIALMLIGTFSTFIATRSLLKSKNEKIHYSTENSISIHTPEIQVRISPMNSIKNASDRKRRIIFSTSSNSFEFVKPKLFDKIHDSSPMFEFSVIAGKYGKCFRVEDMLVILEYSFHCKRYVGFPLFSKKYQYNMTFSQIIDNEERLFVYLPGNETIEIRFKESKKRGRLTEKEICTLMNFLSVLKTVAEEKQKIPTSFS